MNSESFKHNDFTVTYWTNIYILTCVCLSTHTSESTTQQCHPVHLQTHCPVHHLIDGVIFTIGFIWNECFPVFFNLYHLVRMWSMVITVPELPSHCSRHHALSLECYLCVSVFHYVSKPKCYHLPIVTVLKQEWMMKGKLIEKGEW